MTSPRFGRPAAVVARHRPANLRNDSREILMTTDRTGPIGFGIRPASLPGQKVRHAVRAQLITTIALAVSTVIAVTAVSIGMARAGVAATGLMADGGSLAATLMGAGALAAMALAAFAGWKALAVGGRARKEARRI
jgi:hypothetical protein